MKIHQVQTVKSCFLCESYDIFEGHGTVLKGNAVIVQEPEGLLQGKLRTVITQVMQNHPMNDRRLFQLDQFIDHQAHQTVFHWFLLSYKALRYW